MTRLLSVICVLALLTAACSGDDGPDARAQTAPAVDTSSSDSVASASSADASAADEAASEANSAPC